jgi:hypothetical protein
MMTPAGQRTVHYRQLPQKRRLSCGARRDFEFWSAKADEIADLYREYGAAIHAQYQARF